MISNRYTLSKAERLSWKRDIDILFAEGKSFVAYPFRVVFLLTADSEKRSVPVSILTSVSKKRFKRAVKRNKVKRQTREAYRQQKHELSQAVREKNMRLTVAFLYLEKKIHPQADIDKAMTKALNVLKEKTE